MAPKPYVRGVGLTRRLLVYPDRIEAQARHPVYYSWETIARFDPDESYKATVYAQSAKPWPTSKVSTKAFF
jgi:hypothetical protein